MPAYTVDVERSRLRFFAKATGQNDPAYTDEAAARAAGHPALPVPPTFLFCLEMDAPDPGALRRQMGIDIALILHGEQRFAYTRPLLAGDTVVHASGPSCAVDCISACASSPADWNRWLGSLASARRITCSIAGGMSGRKRCGGGGASSMCLRSRSNSESPRNGRRPVAHSNRMTPIA